MFTVLNGIVFKRPINGDSAGEEGGGQRERGMGETTLTGNERNLISTSEIKHSACGHTVANSRQNIGIISCRAFGMHGYQPQQPADTSCVLSARGRFAGGEIIWTTSAVSVIGRVPGRSACGRVHAAVSGEPMDAEAPPARGYEVRNGGGSRSCSAVALRCTDAVPDCDRWQWPLLACFAICPLIILIAGCRSFLPAFLALFISLGAGFAW